MEPASATHHDSISPAQPANATQTTQQRSPRHRHDLETIQTLNHELKAQNAVERDTDRFKAMYKCTVIGKQAQQSPHSLIQQQQSACISLGSPLLQCLSRMSKILGFSQRPLTRGHAHAPGARASYTVEGGPRINMQFFKPGTVTTHAEPTAQHSAVS